MRARHSSSTDSAIPTSSMADIAFLLIIFFMVTAVFSATKGLEMRLPPDDEEDQWRRQFDVKQIHILTQGDIADYVEIFGIDPLTSQCG
jgi:biopolymer transport protein ExbD